MQMQNIQNMMQQYGMYSGNNKIPGSGTAHPHMSDSIKNSTAISGFSFTLDIKQFSMSEINDQGQYFQTFSLQDLHISISEIQLTATSETAPGTDETSAQQGFDLEGYWGIEQTSDRLADFVISGGGENLERLKQGREGILQGLKQAEEMWGGELPEISYKTIEAALSRIDDRIHELGGSVIDIAA